MSEKIQLGWKVKNRMSGLVGIATHRVQYAYQEPHICIQPEGTTEDGYPRSSHVCDESMVEVLERETAFKPEPPNPDVIAMGAKVRDPVTGFEGTVMGRAVYFTGCQRLYVKPKLVEGKMVEGEFFPEQQLEVIAPPKPKKEAAPTDTTEPAPKRKGGPPPADSRRSIPVPKDWGL